MRVQGCSSSKPMGGLPFRPPRLLLDSPEGQASLTALAPTTRRWTVQTGRLRRRCRVAVEYARGAVICYSPPCCNRRLSQFVEQRLGFFQIGGIKPLGERVGPRQQQHPWWTSRYRHAATNFETAGRVLLGLDPGTPQLWLLSYPLESGSFATASPPLAASLNALRVRPTSGASSTLPQLRVPQ
jgi:hypothetical protein